MNEIVGRVVEIMRYPVKSMAGEPLDTAELDWQGIEGDRQYSFYRQSDGSRFPWLSGRNLSGLVRFVPRFREPASPRKSAVDVRVPDGLSLTLDDPELIAALSEAADEALALLQVARGIYDAMPVSIATTATHAALDASHGAPIDRRRFRTNILIEADVRETEWCGRRLGFGDGDTSAQLALADGIPRCAFITVDPDTAERDPKILRTVARRFANQIGVYASPARPGSIAVGDPVRLYD